MQVRYQRTPRQHCAWLLCLCCSLVNGCCQPAATAALLASIAAYACEQAQAAAAGKKDIGRILQAAGPASMGACRRVTLQAQVAVVSRSGMRARQSQHAAERLAVKSGSACSCARVQCRIACPRSGSGA